MTQSGNNGALQGPAMPPDLGGIASIMRETLHALAPHLAPDMVDMLVQQTLHEQAMLGRVIEDALPTSESAKKYPFWGYRIVNARGESGVVRIPKDLASLDMQQIAHAAALVGLLTSPVARGVLYAYGYRLEFAQFPPPVEAPKIVTP